MNAIERLQSGSVRDLCVCKRRTASWPTLMAITTCFFRIWIQEEKTGNAASGSSPSAFTTVDDLLNFCSTAPHNSHWLEHVTMCSRASLGRYTNPLPRLPLVYTLPVDPPSHSLAVLSTMYFSPLVVTRMPSRYLTYKSHLS